MRSSTDPGASLLTSLAAVVVSDLSPMSTSIPSSSGDEELGEGGVAKVGVRKAVADNLILKSIGESETAGGDTGLSSASGAREARAERAAPNLASSSLCSESNSRWERDTGAGGGGGWPASESSSGLASSGLWAASSGDSL